MLSFPAKAFRALKVTAEELTVPVADVTSDMPPTAGSVTKIKDPLRDAVVKV